MVALLLAGQVALANDLALVNAVKRGDLASLQSLLERKADVNAARADGTTALAWAVYMDNPDAVDQLIRAGANVNTATDYGVTPLALACENGNAEVVRKLLKAGADPNHARQTGVTPLMTCANTGALDAVKELLAHGADANLAEYKKDQTALMWAAAERHSEVVRALVESGADIHLRSKVIPEAEPFIIDLQGQNAFGTNYPDTIRFYKSTGGFTALHFVAQQGDIESAQILLAAGADVNSPHPENGSPLVIAIASGHEDLAMFLLEKGADPNIKDAWGVAPLHFALHKGLLILNNFSPSATDYLGWERDNKPKLVEALLSHGADPNARIEYAYPYLDNPILSRSEEDPPQIDPVGATPLLLAAASGDVESMRILVERGSADRKATTIGGATVFMLAAGGGAQRGARNEKDALEAARLALSMGGDVNAHLVDIAKDGPAKGKQDGRTPLHFASALGWTEMIRYLIENGADIHAKDRYGMTPILYALGDPEGRLYRHIGDGNKDDRFRGPRFGGNSVVADLLLELGAEAYTGEYRDRAGE